MRKTRISETIGNINQKYVNEANSYTGDTKIFHFPALMKHGAIVACIAMLIAIGFGVFQISSLGGKEQIATLDNGNTISFVKASTGVPQLDSAFEVETRNLTNSEIEVLFGNLPIDAYALFSKENSSILGIEGRYEEMKLLVSTPIVNLKDTIIVGKEAVSEVDGISVNAGYFTNGTTVIYYATFELGENTVYIENAGLKDESETVKNDIASAIQKLIALGQINLSDISK